MFLSHILSLLITFGSYCYGFVLLSSVAAGSRDSVFQIGKSWTYQLETTVLLNNVGEHEKNVGFQIVNDIVVSCIWSSPEKEHHKLIKIEVLSPKLRIKSRKAPEPEGFIQHSSPLDTLPNYPFYISWNYGTINKIYVDERESLSLLNLKKGIASLFQFQILDGNVEEIDTSGKCNVIYTSIDPKSFSKTKLNCTDTQTNELPFLIHPNPLLSNVINSKRQATYTLNDANTQIDTIVTQEFHEMVVAIRKDVGAYVHTIQKLTIKPNGVQTITPLDANNIQGVLRKLETLTGAKINEDTLLAKPETSMQQQPNLITTLKENREWLKDEKLGSVRSANTFIKMLNAARVANRDEITKVLKHSRNKDILLQLYDIVGFAQTDDAHDAAMKMLRFHDEDDFDAAERYLWALSMGSHPTFNMLNDILKLSKKDTISDPKLKETVLLTLGAMANRYAKNPLNQNKLQIVKKITESLLNGLDFCKDDEECAIRYLRALQNLQEPSTLNKLMDYALNGPRKVSVTAMKAIHSLPRQYWTEQLLKTCHKIFYMISKPYDSSARTLALDIILESKPDNKTLEELVHFLISGDVAFEVKQYLLQRLRMISEINPDIRNSLILILNKYPKLNNYHVLAQKGLTTAFSRPFTNSPSYNGSLVTIQEINGGLLKRGIVDVVLESNGVSQEMFRLGLFAGGLSSFASSGTENKIVDPSNDPDESANAGMEISVLGVQIRPFVFFSGQGELMGHVWSGTASEKTPAYQALILLHDHLEHIRLGVGIMAAYKLLGTTSFDLSGHIQLSLWNRNAQSWVEKNAGILLFGILQVDTLFVKSQVEFTLSAEPKLNLQSNIDFSSGVSLCMQLKQPDVTLKHNIYKIERIPGSKHKLRKSVYKVLKIPGKTYSLNRKNNEMCNTIFSNK